MKKKILLSLISLCGFGVFASVVAVNSISLTKTVKADSLFFLSLSSTKNKLDFNASSTSIYTNLGNSIILNYSGITENENGWATLGSNSFFYNPLIEKNNENTNKISGIHSVKAILETGDSKNLNISFGWLKNNEYEFNNHTLVGNEEYDFEGFHPSYFKVSNLNNESVAIKEFQITYSCSESEPHEHTWDEGTVTKEATCAETGLKVYHCSECSETKTDIIPISDIHEWGAWVIVSPATCTEDGQKKRVCEVCGDEEFASIPKLSDLGEHNWGEWSIIADPTCVDKGLKMRSCIVCGEVEYEDIPATNIHTWGAWIIDDEPTFEEEGLRHHVCGVCGEVEYEAIDPLIAEYHINVDYMNGETDVIPVTAGGNYSLITPEKEGYVFSKYIDENDNDFPSTGIINENKTIYAVYNVAPTATLEQLVSRAAAGIEDIKIAQDIVVTETIYVSGNVTITADSNVSLIRDPGFDGDMIVIGEDKDGNNPLLNNNPATLNLGELGMSGSIAIDGNKNNTTVDVAGTLVYLSNSSTFNMYDGITLKNNNKVKNERTISDGESLFKRRLGGGAVIIYDGRFNLYGGLIDNNSVLTSDLSTETGDENDSYYSSYGGAIVNCANFYMYGGTISNNKAARGGAIYGGNLNYLVAGVIDSNKALYSVAGAFYAMDASSTEIYLGSTSGTGYSLEITNNTSKSNGGAIYGKESVYLSVLGHVLFDGNATNSNGGAIWTSGRLNIEPTSSGHVTFSNNSAKNNGGALYAYYISTGGTRTTMRISNTAFNSNSAKNGGAISSCGANIYLTLSNLTSNSASSSGGAIFGEKNEDDLGAYFYSSSTTFSSNTAAEGGAMYLARNATFECSNAQIRFVENYSTGNGGAIALHAAILKLTGSNTNNAYFNQNIADGNGGAIYISYTTNPEDTSTGWDSSVSVTKFGFNNNTGVYGAAIYGTVKNAGSDILSVNDCSFVLNSASNGGGAISLSNALATIKTSSFTSNTAKNGGGLYLSGSEVDITSCTFLENSVTNNGAAIYASNSTLNTGSSSFAEGTASTGSALYLSSSNYVGYSDTFTGNETLDTSYGGTIYSSGTVLDISSSTFTSNTSEANGAAISLYSNSVATVDSSTFTDNTSVSGGAIYSNSSTLSDNSSTFSNNSATSSGYGGGSVYGTGSSLSFVGTTFDGNTAYNGGAVGAYSSSTLTLDGVSAYSNSSTNFAGFAFIRNSNLIIDQNASESIIGAENRGNTSANGGAIYVSTNSDLVKAITLYNVKGEYNSATGLGGFIYIAGGTVNLNIYDSQFNSNSAHDGGFIGVETITNAYIENSSFAGNTANLEDSGLGGAIYALPYLNSNKAVIGHSSFEIVNSTFTSNQSTQGGAIYIRETVVLETSSTAFTSNYSSTYGGAIASHGANITLSSGTNFINNNSKSRGGAIYASYTSSGSYDTSIEGTEVIFTSNSSAYGGAVYSVTKTDLFTTLTFSSSTFTENSSTKYGGAIVLDGSTIILSGTSNAPTTFDNNTAANEGGAIYATSSVLEANYTIFSENNSSSKGGAIYLLNCNNNILSNLTFDSNSASSGGAIYFEGSASELSSSLLTNNTSSSTGGALYLIGSSSLSLNNSTFRYNESENSHGGVGGLADSSVLTSSENIFESNVSAENGGVFYLSGSSSLVDSSSQFKSNVSSSTTYGGGAIYSTGSTISLTQSSFDGNSAANGGAIALYSNSNGTLNGIEAYSNVATSQGGFVYVRNSVLNSGVTLTSYVGKANEGNSASYGGAVSISVSSSSYTANVNLSNFDFSYNNSVNCGGCFYSSGNAVTLTLNNCDFISNSSINGGSIGLTSSVTATINNCSFNENKATSEDTSIITKGGAIYAIPTLNSKGVITGVPELIVSNSTFENNEANEGGAIYTEQTVDVSITDSTFSGNEATTGAALLSRGSAYSITGSTFSSNIATGDGGAIYGSYISDGNYDSLIEIFTSSFSSNESSNGGAIYVTAINTGVNTLNIESSSFNNNSSSNNGGALFLSKSVVNLTGTSALNIIIDGNTAVGTGGAVYVTTGTTFNSTYASYLNNNTSAALGGGAIYANGGAVSNITSCLFIGNSGPRGGGYAGYSSSVLNISGVTAYNNTGTNYGGFVYLNKASMYSASDSLPSYIGTTAGEDNLGNTSKYGGGISAYSTGQVINLYNVTIQYNSGTTNGGGIFVQDATTLTLNNCVVSDNSTSGNGGAIYCSIDENGTIDPTITINNSTISNNNGKNGGAIYSQRNVIISLNTVNFTGNVGTTHGGAIYATNAVNITGDSVVFNSNSSSSNGGALYLYNSDSNALILFSNSDFISNTAGSNGGAIYMAQSANVELENCEGNENNATSYGGFIYFTTSSTLTLKGLSLNSNTAKKYPDIRMNSASSTCNVYTSYSYELNGSTVSSTNVSSMFSIASGGSISYV